MAMRDELLAAIRRNNTLDFHGSFWAVRDINVLLAEVDRLRAENTAMRPIVETVADIENSDGSACWVTCELTLFDSTAPDEGVHHDTPCLIEQARAFVETHPAAESEA